MEYYDLLPVTVLHGTKSLRENFEWLVQSLVKRMKKKQPISRTRLAESSVVKNLIRAANKYNATFGDPIISDEDFLTKSRYELADYAISHAEDELQIYHYQHIEK